ncbi:MAG: DNA double-strand break repair nuclease NurA [Trichocoleus desertorum ATA4-8-CV12]|jgi:hypothetical protein|nr:DNA double-strand break repair nuclease NurA [Trichocoleus desertorum ATA4-8-CV12]
MALKSAQVLALLQAKQADFKTFDQTALNALQKYRAALAEASQKTAAALEKMLATARHSGASPLEPVGSSPNWVVASNLAWQNREQSLSWVRDRLIGIATFAVDGSQIFPTKDFSIPVALVQIGWFENLHLPSGTYEKDVAVDVMTPADLKVSHSGEPVDRRVNMRRFEMETQRLIQYMQEHKNCNDCLVFFDGSLIATFAEAFDPDTRAFYVDCLLELLQTSEDYRVPLVAYIDTSYARDLTVMLQQGFHLPEANSIHDAQLLGKFMSWGDRTPLFLCQRSGILAQYQEQTNKIAFTYLKTTHDGYPARLEMPVWMHQAGIVDRVLDWVRGEVIIGNGYPYVIETADQTAVLQAEDRHTFYRIFQDWAEREELNLRLSRKMVSKARRR